MGVSATHLDWTLVPYVRKSFYKHYKDGLRYIEKLSEDNINALEPMEGYGIDNEGFKKFAKAYDYALDMTEKEVHQGAEGLFHNLNTLQSRSGNQLEKMAG
jgi:ribonucleoside-triphosphate reductase